jgi:hypothetical protein
MAPIDEHRPRDIDEALEALMLEDVDSLLQAEHEQSERSRPHAADVLVAMPSCSRQNLIKWMMQSFEILGLDDQILHGVQLTLDRYYARRITKVDDHKLHQLVLSALCLELKTGPLSAEYHENGWKSVLSHLSQGHISVANILRAELELLNELGFVVGAPTPLSFLRILGMRLRGEPKETRSRLMNVATFFLELALLDVDVAYGFPHCILAAGALSAACVTLKDTLKISESRREQLLEGIPALWTGSIEKKKRQLTDTKAADLFAKIECRHSLQQLASGTYSSRPSAAAVFEEHGAGDEVLQCQERLLAMWQQGLDEQKQAGRGAAPPSSSSCFGFAALQKKFEARPCALVGLSPPRRPSTRAACQSRGIENTMQASHANIVASSIDSCGKRSSCARDDQHAGGYPSSCKEQQRCAFEQRQVTII